MVGFPRIVWILDKLFSNGGAVVLLVLLAVLLVVVMGVASFGGP